MAGDRNVAHAHQILLNAIMSNLAVLVFPFAESHTGKTASEPLAFHSLDSTADRSPLYSSGSFLEARVAELEKILHETRPGDVASERSVLFRPANCLRKRPYPKKNITFAVVRRWSTFWYDRQYL